MILLKNNKRHIAKTFTWRIVATSDTILLSLIIIGNLNDALSIGLIEILTKSILYFLHEKIWFISPKVKASLRHIFKTITGRFLGTTDTIIIAFLISGKFEMGITLAVAETLTKIVLYYIHEKIWYKSKYGL